VILLYSVEFSDTALKQLNKLEGKTRERIISSLERCRVRPYTHIERLVDSPYFRLRVGTYRIILRITEEKLLILVVEIGHRRNIYKK